MSALETDSSSSFGEKVVREREDGHKLFKDILNVHKQMEALVA